jgi:hypothetical protein
MLLSTDFVGVEGREERGCGENKAAFCLLIIDY